MVDVTSSLPDTLYQLNFVQIPMTSNMSDSRGKTYLIILLSEMMT